jgi:hypothetical protein
MRHILNKIANLAKRAVITKTNDDSKNVAYCQISYLDRVRNMVLMYPYGMSAQAPVGNIVMHWAIGGNEANLIGVPYSQQGRFQGLKDGEVVFGSPVTGSYTKYTVDKNILFHSEKDVDFTTTVGKNKFNNVELINATASRLLATDASKDIVSSDLINWTHTTSLNITDDGIGGVNINLSGSYEPSITIGTNLQYWRGDKSWQTLDTLAVTENTNLYYTDARARAAISNSAPITYNSSSGVIGITQAATSANGYLSSTDWNTFNNKQAALTIGNLTEATSSILTISSGTGAVIGTGTSIQVQKADTTHAGYLSSTDWNTFNGKQAALGYTPLRAGTASAYLTPANPTALTSTSYLMFGLGSTLSFTPTQSGIIRFSIKYVPGGVGTTGLNNFKLAYGSGAAPANAAAATGTVVGGVDQGGAIASVNATPALNQRNVIVTGLTPGVTYWFDIQGAKNAAHTSVGIFSIESTIQELSF